MASKLAPNQIYALAIKAGFKPQAAKTMTAIILAESGGHIGAVGDHNNPGPGASSVGLSQINFLPSRDKGNSTRDPKANLDPLTNLRNAYKISKGGTNFNPWSTYTTNDPSKSYKQFTSDASKFAMGASGSKTIPTSSSNAQSGAPTPNTFAQQMATNAATQAKLDAFKAPMDAINQAADAALVDPNSPGTFGCCKPICRFGVCFHRNSCCWC